jgi:hypothetical protein
MKLMKKLIIFFAVLFFSLNAFAALTVSSRTYSGSTETVKYTNGTSATFNSTSAPVTWASDHITKTITYTFADGTKNPVVSTVQPTIGKTYNVGAETVVTTYGDGTKTTVTNNSTSAPVTWASDHITKTITYTFADGTTNSVSSTQQPTQAGVILTPANYPSNWTTTGTVLKPSVSSLVNQYGDGTVSTLEAGTLSSPFNEATLQNKGITDPNAVVKTPTNIQYDLSWGTPDKNGPSYANLFGNNTSGSIPLNNINVMGYLVNGTLGAPHQEVLNAWNQGWTGQGKNILMVDNYLSTDEYSHGVTTMLIAKRYAF